VNPPIEVAEFLAHPQNEGCSWHPTHHLDEKGRCCGRKPLQYKRAGELFCGRCHRTYSLSTRQQISNWAWGRTVGGWIKFKHHATSHPAPPPPTGPAA